MSATSSALAILNQFKSNHSEGGEHSDEADQEGWLVSYADLITLLFVFFAILLSISTVSKAKLEMLSHEVNQENVSSLSEIKKELDQEINKQDLNSQVNTQMTNDGLQIQFNERVLFGLGDAKMSSEGSKVLQQFCHTLAEIKGKFYLAVEGHTDSKPIHTAAFPSNWALSAARSVNVLHFLAAHGVDEKRMMVRAYADTRPLKSSPESDPASDQAATGDAEAKNRRVTLLVF